MDRLRRPQVKANMLDETANAVVLKELAALSPDGPPAPHRYIP